MDHYKTVYEALQTTHISHEQCKVRYQTLLQETLEVYRQPISPPISGQPAQQKTHTRKRKRKDYPLDHTIPGKERNQSHTQSTPIQKHRKTSRQHREPPLNKGTGYRTKEYPSSATSFSSAPRDIQTPSPSITPVSAVAIGVALGVNNAVLYRNQALPTQFDTDIPDLGSHFHFIRREDILISDSQGPGSYAASRPAITQSPTISTINNSTRTASPFAYSGGVLNPRVLENNHNLYHNSPIPRDHTYKHPINHLNSRGKTNTPSSQHRTIRHDMNIQRMPEQVPHNIDP